MGGDLNETLVNSRPSIRSKYIGEFIEEFSLKYQSAGRTYVSPNGAECSEIDYFIHNLNDNCLGKNQTVLKDICSETSDHYPIKIELSWNQTKVQGRRAENGAQRLNWKKVDLDLYSAFVNQGIDKLKVESLNEDNIEGILQPIDGYSCKTSM